MATATARKTTEQRKATEVIGKLGPYWLMSEYIAGLLIDEKGDKTGEKAANVFARFVGLHDLNLKRGGLKRRRGVVGFPLNLETMAEKTGASLRTVWKHVNRIMKAGLVGRIDGYNETPIYYLTEKFWNLPEQYAAEKAEKISRIEQEVAEIAEAQQEQQEQAVEVIQQEEQPETVEEKVTERQAVKPRKIRLSLRRFAKFAKTSRKNCKTILLESVIITITFIKNIERYDDTQAREISQKNSRPTVEKIHQPKRRETFGPFTAEELEDIERKKELYADNLQALTEKVQNLTRWSPDRMEDFTRYLLARTDWAGVYFEAAVDALIARMSSEYARQKWNPRVIQRYLASAIDNEFTVTLFAMKAALAAEDKQRQEEQERQERLQQFNQLDTNNITGEFAEVFSMTS